jgi:hypothetical protein
MTDFRALCAELLAAWLKGVDISGPMQRARAALAQPDSEGPTIMEIIELHTWLEDEWRANNDGEDLPIVDFARAVLARWGRPAITPIPVSERLPGPEDCDAEGRSWFGGKRGIWMLMTSKYAMADSFWLPHHALPVPQRGAEG